jgi:small subunit ribosomal protein S20
MDVITGITNIIASTSTEAHFVANIKSQIKRIKTNEKARLRNQAVKSEVKTAVRQAREAVASGDYEQAEAARRVAARKLDKAVSKGVLHKNNAANKKSALAAQVSSLQS